MSLRPFSARDVTPPADPYEAADWWTAKRALGLLSEREAAALDSWLQDDRNRAAYDVVQGVHEQTAAYAAEPEIREMRAEALSAAPRASDGRRWGRMAASLAVAALMLGGGGWLLLREPSNRAGAVADAGEASLPTAKRYETKVGERREVRLDDGSVVTLNTGSLLEVAYNPARRDVRLLRGQALFRVAHNKAWPFVVSAGDRQVTAVGTAFDVRVDGTRVRVVLLEGKVRVDPVRREGLERLIPQLTAEDLAPGQQLVASAGDREVTIAAADIQRAVSWRSGQVIFRDDTLGGAVAELNRYSETRILVDDPKIAALKVSGVFNTDRPENFVAAVTTFYPIKAAQTARGVTEISWRDPR
jgi:transmembrane sensor